MSSETLLTISGLDLTPYSARGIKQTLEPISNAGSMRRTINGTLVDLSIPGMRKYLSTIRCEDMAAPALNGIWPGQIVTVGCAVELSYLTDGGTPDRPVVVGSSRTSGVYTFYRPILTMRVMEFFQQLDEWEAVTNWDLRLEEV